MKGKSDKFILEEHLDKITHEPICVLCLRSLDGIPQEERGIIEFYNGWWWICPNCKRFMREFDQTQFEPWSQQTEIPYFRKSRKWWVAWLEKEYDIKIKRSEGER